MTGKLPGDVNLIALADPGASTVIFMGKRTFPELLGKLLAHGLPEDTPAILAEDVSRPEQKITRATVSVLAEKLSQEVGNSAGLILYGPLAEGDERFEPDAN